MNIVVGNQYIGFYLDDRGLAINLLLIQLIIYYKKNISINIGITIYNIIFEFSIRSWKHDAMSILLNKINQREL